MVAGEEDLGGGMNYLSAWLEHVAWLAAFQPPFEALACAKALSVNVCARWFVVYDDGWIVVLGLVSSRPGLFVNTLSWAEVDGRRHDPVRQEVANV